jgi:hypothetical protein
MEANLRSVPAGRAEEADAGETASFEEFRPCSNGLELAIGWGS